MKTDFQNDVPWEQHKTVEKVMVGFQRSNLKHRTIESTCMYQRMQKDPSGGRTHEVLGPTPPFKANRQGDLHIMTKFRQPPPNLDSLHSSSILDEHELNSPS